MKSIIHPGGEGADLTEYEAGVEKESFCLYCDNLDLHLDPAKLQQEHLTGDQINNQP